jgi:hypothetical protein
MRKGQKVAKSRRGEGGLDTLSFLRWMERTGLEGAWSRRRVVCGTSL